MKNTGFVLCFPFGFLSQTGFTWLQFHFCLHFSQMRREQDVMFTPENKNEIIHTSFMPFCHQGWRPPQLLDWAHVIWTDVASWKCRKVHLSKWWWSRFKTIFEQLRWSACFKFYMHASLQTYNECQRTSTANQNNPVRGEMFVMRLRVSGCWEKHYETFMWAAYMGTAPFVTTLVLRYSHCWQPFLWGWTPHLPLFARDDSIWSSRA